MKRSAPVELEGKKHNSNIQTDAMEETSHFYQKEYLDSFIKEEQKGRKTNAAISVNIASTTTSPVLGLM